MKKVIIKTIQVIDPHSLWDHIGKQAEMARKRAGITQVDAAIKLGATRTTITNIEAGRQETPLSRLYTLALIYGCEVKDWLP